MDLILRSSNNDYPAAQSLFGHIIIERIAVNTESCNFTVIDVLNMNSKNAAVMFVLRIPIKPYFINGHEKLETDATQEKSISQVVAKSSKKLGK